MITHEVRTPSTLQLQVGRLDQVAALCTFDALGTDGDSRLPIAAIPAKLRRLAQSLDGDGILTREAVSAPTDGAQL